MSRFHRFYILATGPSINEITRKEWEFLGTQLTVGVSWFAKHPFFQPSFLYFHENNQRKIIHVLTEGWKSTYFITTRKHKVSTGVVNEGRVQFITYTSWIEAFNGETWYNDQAEPPASFKDVWAKSFDEPLFGFRGSLVAAMNAATILGATEIFLCGVDMRNTKHFYEGEEYSAFDKLLMEEKGIELTTHSSAISFDNIRTAVDCIGWLSKHIRIYTTNRESLLYRKRILKYRPIICY